MVNDKEVHPKFGFSFNCSILTKFSLYLEMFKRSTQTQFSSNNEHKFLSVCRIKCQLTETHVITNPFDALSKNI